MNILSKSEKHYKNKRPFVMYRKPNQTTIYGFFQNCDTLFATENYNTPGFVFAPFDSSLPTYILPTSECDVLSEELTDSILFQKKNRISFDANEDSKKDHLHLIKKAIEEIQRTSLQKIVVSRVEKIDSESFNCFQSFINMVLLYSNAFVYLWYHPEEGMWLGATPETLVKVNKDTFQTIALAGTQVFEGTLNVEWGKKELQEHQFVVDYIVSQLSNSNSQIHNVHVSPTHTVKAGKLLHLRADINGSLKKNELKELILTLHPTPAVCGLPMQEAKEFILNHENYNREFYTGFLGEIHLDNSSELYVNLRCMQVKHQRIKVYVGGGITKDSIPEKEWEETVNKSETMKQIL